VARTLNVLVLAAGEGKRMKSAIPKVLMDLLGWPMLRHVVAAARRLRPARIVVIGGRHLPKIRKAFEGERDVAYARQPKPLGTAHAVRFGLKALPRGTGDVLVLSGDVPLVTPDTLRSLVAGHRRGRAAVTVLTAVVRDPSGLGRIVRDDRGQLSAIVEERDADAATREIREINSGIYVFDRARLGALIPQVGRANAQGEYYLTDVVGLERRSGGAVRLVAAPDPGEVAGINRPAELVVARDLLQRRVFEEHLARGVRITAPHLTCIEAGVSIGEGTVIEPFSVIRSAVSIAPFSRVGPFAHLRAGTRLDQGAQVGNFVEVKASRIGSGTKALHLSYLGDAQVGPGANIGAGTITANWDGRKKHRTRIGAGAQIGSGTVLIAPVAVGRSARTGAGAIVLASGDVPAGATAVGIPARVIHGGPRPGAKRRVGGRVAAKSDKKRRSRSHGNQKPRNQGADSQGKRRGPPRAPRGKRAGRRLRPGS
jgi:bifunctional UDP-N-acetylglucosamine pyrophosphorylase/glucosamine-1-phosphate N-acetyltransferase